MNSQLKSEMTYAAVLWTLGVFWALVLLCVLVACGVFDSVSR